MRPLQSVAMGLVIVALDALFGPYDAVPDPVGWVLVLLGVARLPADLESRGVLLLLAWASLALSVPLWWPAVVDEVAEADASLGWALSLPSLAFAVLLALGLARAAERAGDRGAAAGGRSVATAFVVVALLPVLVFGGGLDGLAEVSGAAVVVAQVWLVWLLFAWSARSWAGPSAPGVDWTGA